MTSCDDEASDFRGIHDAWRHLDATPHRSRTMSCAFRDCDQSTIAHFVHSATDTLANAAADADDSRTDGERAELPLADVVDALSNRLISAVAVSIDGDALWMSFRLGLSIHDAPDVFGRSGDVIRSIFDVGFPPDSHTVHLSGPTGPTTPESAGRTPPAKVDRGRPTAFTLCLPPDSASISVARSAMRHAVAFRDDDASSTFLIALTELIANAVDEHHRLGLDEPISVAAVFGPTDNITVLDRGRALDVDRATSTTAAGSLDERGRGLALARAFVPGLSLIGTDRGTTATLPLAGFGVLRGDND